MRRDAPTSEPGGNTRLPNARKSSWHDEGTSHTAGATVALMLGGNGIDSYLYKIGDGNDIIINSDRKGRIAKVSLIGAPSNDAWRVAA